MPELPEVETVARSLAPQLTKGRLSSFFCYQKRVLENVKLSFLQTILQGAVIEKVGRRGKLLIFSLDRGYLMFHLRMTGRLYTVEKKPRQTKYLSAVFGLADGNWLLFEDPRRFGRIYWFAGRADSDRFLQRLGPEPLESSFSGRWLADNFNRRRRQIKALLLDQSFIAGLGNIYVDEALWLAQIHPLTESHQIDFPAALRLRKAIRQVLRKSIALNGATLRDFRFLGNRRGGYADQTLVFGRAQQPCRRCEQPIIKIRVAGRGTHLCPNCQNRAKL